MENKDRGNAQKNKQPFLSIIVPVYNVEKYLAECLDSLVEQDVSYEDYEVICVNDGSTDGCLKILQQYEKNNANIRVIEQKNAGVCVARNTGMDAAQGEYIWFVDSDDQIRRNGLGLLKEKLEAQWCDRLVLGSIQFEGVLAENPEQQNYPVNASWEDSVVWRSVFRRAFLQENHLRFYPGLVFGEDALFMFECFYREPKVVKTEEPVYYHRVVPNSASSNQSPAFAEKRMWSTLTEAKVLQKYQENGDKKYRTETANRLMIFLWGILGATAHMPKKAAKPYMDELKRSGLYPYHRPRARTVTRSYQTTRTDALGKLFDKCYTNSHTRLGFGLLRCWYGVSDLKNKLLKKEKQAL